MRCGVKQLIQLTFPKCCDAWEFRICVEAVLIVQMPADDRDDRKDRIFKQIRPSTIKKWIASFLSTASHEEEV